MTVTNYRNGSGKQTQFTQAISQPLQCLSHKNNCTSIYFCLFDQYFQVWFRSDKSCFKNISVRKIFLSRTFICSKAEVSLYLVNNTWSAVEGALLHRGDASPGGRLSPNTTAAKHPQQLDIPYHSKKTKSRHILQSVLLFFSSIKT